MIDGIIGFFLLIGEIFIKPWTHPDMLWLILPLVLILILIHLYFGRYRNEQLGWNSAFSNSISLLWICIILIHYLFDKYEWPRIILELQAVKSLFVVGVLSLWVILLVVYNYFHIMQKNLAFVISSSDFVYILAYIIISLVMGEFELNLQVFLAAGVLFFILIEILNIIKRSIPMTKYAKKVIEKKEEKEKRIKAGKKAARTRKLNEVLKK